VSFALFYMGYAFVSNWAYDHLFRSQNGRGSKPQDRHARERQHRPPDDLSLPQEIL
jgi:hypothetical protein